MLLLLGVAHPNLAHPPVTEALIELAAAFDVSPPSDSLKAVADRLESSYPGQKRHFAWRAQVHLESGKEPVLKQPENKETGIVLTSPDKLHVLQVRSTGIRFSRLKPYAGWKTFSAEARNVWQVYSEVLKPNSVNRLGVRFLNRITLPSPVDLKQYLKTGPELAPGLPQLVGQFFFRVVVPVDPVTLVTVTEMSDAATAAPGKLAFVLDVETALSTAFLPDSEDIWPALDRLRALKNDFFFGSLTDKAIAHLEAASP